MPEPPASPHLAGPVAVTGASGLLGSALVRRLRTERIEVLRLVRTPPDPSAGEIGWDPDRGTVDGAALEGVAAVVHLAGENVGKRWTSRRKERIRSSRIGGTAALAKTLASLARPPEALVSASAVGYYGDRGDERLDESSAPGTDFLGRMGVEWEAAADPARQAGIRVVNPRFGVVLSRHGGALARLLPFFRLGVGGRLGSGKQWMSWVSLADAVDAIRFALVERALRGPVNVMAPRPVTNAEFTRVAGRVLGRPTLLPVPAAALRLVYGEMADATLLASQRALPGKLRDAGFEFRHPSIEEALRAAIREDA